MRGSPFFQKKTHYGLAVILVIILLSALFDTREHFNLHIKPHKHSKHSKHPDVSRVKNRKILILYTGGTIGMKETPQGYAPKKGYLEKQLKKILNIHADYSNTISPYHIKEYHPLLDSSNMTPKDWNKMAHDIEKHYHQYDAFIIVHGTDTLAYSATALSFIFKNLSKTVIFTASMIPLARIRNDGQNNLLSSLILASTYDIPEVVIVTANSITRGNRTTKKSANKVDAFACPNFEDLGAFGYATAPILKKSLIRKPHGPFSVTPYNTENQVMVFFLTPGCNFKSVEDSILSNPSIKGIVLLTYGIGDGPVNNKEFIHMLQFLKAHHIIAINITQCYQGRVDQDDYATGTKLKEHGVLSGKDMTYEAGYCKLLFLLGKYPKNYHKISSVFETDIRGEMSEVLKTKNVAPTK